MEIIKVKYFGTYLKNIIKSDYYRIRNSEIKKKKIDIQRKLEEKKISFLLSFLPFSFKESKIKKKIK